MFSVSAFANPIVIGGAAVAGAGIAYAIASAMGVDLSFSGFSEETVDNWISQFYSGSQSLSLADFVWNKAQTIPQVAIPVDILTISGNAVSAILGFGSDVIVDNNITDNSSGSVVNNQSSYTYNGFDTYPISGYSNALAFGEPIFISGAGSYSVAGVPFTVSKSGNNYAVTVYNSTGSISWYSNYGEFFPCTVYAVIATLPNNAQLKVAFEHFGVIPNVRITAPNLSPAMPVSVTTNPAQSVSYTSGTVDTTFGSSAESISIAFPSDQSLGNDAEIDDILAVLTDLALGASQDVYVLEDYVPPPGPSPLPADSLGGTPYATWTEDFGQPVVDTIGNISDTAEDIYDVIGLYGEDIVDAVDTVGSVIEDQTDVIDTVGQGIIDELENVADVADTVGQGIISELESQTSFLDVISSAIDSVIEGVDSLVDSIADVGVNVIEAIKTEILGDIGKLETVFAPIITRLRSAFSIWHYVVEWIGSIGSVFGWIMGVAGGTSYYMVLPVYACIAGGIVLGVYRRFGR